MLANRTSLSSTHDFHAYRKRCTRKIHALRRKHQLITRPTKSASPKPQQGNSEILLWQAERCWATAMELRSTQETHSTPGLRRQSLNKLAKAASYAAKAAELDPTISSKTIAALHKADSHAARNSWEIPLSAYSEARLGLETFKDPVYSDIISTHIDPALKLAIARTGGSELDTATFSRKTARSTDLGKLVAKEHPELLEAALDPPSKKLGTIEWSGHTATVEDADLAQQLLVTREADAKLDPSNADQFEPVLQHWADALDIVKGLLQGAEPEDQLHIVATYIEFSLLSRRIQRDDFASAAVEPKAGIRLYDNILQSCTQLSELPGVYADEMLGQSIDAMIAYYQSRRCGLLARAYAQHDMVVEALALISRAKQLLEGDSIAVHTLPVTKQAVDQWRKSIDLDLKRAHGSVLIHNMASSRPVAHDMSVFPSGKPHDVLSNIIDTTRIQPIPVKPVFYDLAYSYINYP